MGKGNFFSKLVGSIFGGMDPEVAKRKALKNIAKTLSKTKHHFYKPSSNEVDSSLAKFFYEIYKAIAPAQSMMQSFSPNAFKSMTLHYAMSEKQLEAMELLSENSINEAARGKTLKEVVDQTKAALSDFTGEFSSNRIVEIDLLYTNLMRFVAFVKFDFYFLLKKFDNSFKEMNFTKTPRFVSVNGSYVVEDLKNFADVAWALPFDSSWDKVFKMIKSVKGADPVATGVWRRVVERIRYLKDNRIIEMLVQLITENPSYRESVALKEQHIVDDFLNDIKKQAEQALNAIKEKQVAGKVEGLLTQVFGTTNIDHLKFYNETGSAPFERKNLGKFEYCEPLSYLKKFILDYVKKDVKELSDILLVRGEWVNQQLASPMSDAFHKILECSDKIIALDNSLDETVDLGLKMKTHLPRTDRDKESRNIIKSTLNFVNDSAGKIILSSNELFITYGKNLKMVIEDSTKKQPALIRNWKDIDHFAEGKLKQMCVDAYKELYGFVSLMQNFAVHLHDED